ncbi:hypothetical protein [Paraglaciecola sp. MB-3u-78]|jgi:hypothetical protein|nr:hypothetical protein [Paraglaciecola sp. MB-3u-78]
MAEQGFLVTSHDLGFVDKIYDRVVVRREKDKNEHVADVGEFD